jgi:hypothetical protein
LKASTFHSRKASWGRTRYPEPEFFCLAAVFALIFLRFFLLVFIEGPLDKPQLFHLYMGAWCSFPILGWLAVEGLERLRQRGRAGILIFYPLALLLNAAFLMLFFSPVGWEKADGLWLAALWILIQLLVWKGSFFPAWPRALSWITAGLFAVWSAWLFLIPRPPEFPLSWHPLWFLPVLLLFYGGLWSGPGNRWQSRRVAWIFGGAALALVFLSVVHPTFSFNFESYTYYLGPLADLQNGKSLLHDVNAIYGVFVFYFLDPFFRLLPLGFRSLCLVLSVLLIIHYFIFYFIARRLLPSAWAFLALLLFLALSCYLTLGAVTDSPSTSPLRFGSIDVLLLLVLARNRHPAWIGTLLVLEALVAGLFFWWSYEVCVYTLPAYAGLIFYEAWLGRRQTGTRSSARPWPRLLWLLAGIGFWGLWLYGDIFIHSGAWPQWSDYFSYIHLYEEGFFMLPLPAWGAWWIPIGVLYFSFWALLARVLPPVRSPVPPHLNAAALLTFYGILQFFYYLGRSDPNNLLHICMPALLLVFYWAFHLGPGPKPRGATPLSLLLVGFTLALILVCFSASWVPLAGKLYEKWPRMKEFPSRLVLALHDEPREDGFALAAKAVMEKYSGPKNRLVYFFGGQDIQVALYDGVSKVYPFDDPNEAEVSPEICAKILRFDPGLKRGDFFYWFPGLFDYRYTVEFMGNKRIVQSGLESRLLAILLARYRVDTVESLDGIRACRVEGVRPGTPP